jgi:hypothetical protein
VPMPVAGQSKAWVYGRSLAGIAVESRRGHICLSAVSVVFCQVVSATGRSLVQRSSTESGLRECDL